MHEKIMANTAHRQEEFQDHRRKFSQIVDHETTMLETLLSLVLTSRKELDKGKADKTL